MKSRSVQPASQSAPEPRRHAPPASVPGSGRTSSADSQTQEQASLVLKRALELADLGPDGVAERGNQLDLLGSSSLVEIAAELDIPLDALAGAIVESRLRVDPGRRSLVDRLIGPAEVWARRSTKESQEVVQARLVVWLERGHGLKPRERHNGVLVAKRRRDLFGKVGKTVRDVQGVGGLAKAQEVEAFVVDLSVAADQLAAGSVDAEFDQGNTSQPSGSIGLSANVADKRSGAIVKGAVVAVGGGFAVGALSIVFAPLTLVVIPIAAGAGVATSRKLHSATVRAMSDVVEETIDGIVTQTEPPRMLGGRRRRR